MKTFNLTNLSRFSLVAVSLMIPLLSWAEPRTFTSPDGRTLKAQVESATPDMVTLKLATGQSVTAPVQKFGPADQAYIAEWRKANPAAIKYSFTASYTKEKVDSVTKESPLISRNSQASNSFETQKADFWVCKMKIANRSGQSLENVKLDYEIYYDEIQRGEKETTLRKVMGSTTIPLIKNFEEVTVPTTEIKLMTSQLNGGFYWKDGGRTRQKDSLVGMAISFSHEGKKVFDWASNGVPKDRTAMGADARTTSAPK